MNKEKETEKYTCNRCGEEVESVKLKDEEVENFICRHCIFIMTGC